MHLYIHVPFCSRRCSYCDFAIAVRRRVPSVEFADAILAEWRTWLPDAGWSASPALNTIYFGGGTPSKLDPVQLARLLGVIKSDRTLEPGAEVTLETNPEDVTAAAAAAWITAGINRISLGVQSFDDSVLQWMHRTHDAAAIPVAITTLRAAGFRNVSIDLIFALPEALGRDWVRDLDAAFALEPDHVSLYGLTVEEGTPLGRWTARGSVSAVADDRYAAEYLMAHAALERHGFEHYEVSNAGRPGFRARHNSAYWRRAPFIGLGPSAHSESGGRRAWNVREWAGYEHRIQASQPVREAEEQLDDDQLRLEDLYLGLRTVDGLPSDRLTDATRMTWAAAGWAKETGGRTRLTVEGWLRLDALVKSVA